MNDQDADPGPSLTIEFCGEIHRVADGQNFVIGRSGDLVVDDENPFLHRRLVLLTCESGFWWIVNVGDRLALTVTGEAGTLHALVGPGSRMPIVLPTLTILFTAGPTTYEVVVRSPGAAFSSACDAYPSEVGTATRGAVALTEDQMRLLVALAEPRLRRVGSGPTNLPTNAAAANRLGWSITRFNRKLDNVCDKYDRAGVKGLRAGQGRHASQRRAHLIEYVVSARIVRPEHLRLLEAVGIDPHGHAPRPVVS